MLKSGLKRCNALSTANRCHLSDTLSPLFSDMLTPLAHLGFPYLSTDWHRRGERRTCARVGMVSGGMCVRAMGACAYGCIWVWWHMVHIGALLVSQWLTCLSLNGSPACLPMAHLWDTSGTPLGYLCETPLGHLWDTSVRHHWDPSLRHHWDPSLRHHWDPSLRHHWDPTPLWSDTAVIWHRCDPTPLWSDTVNAMQCWHR